MKIQHILSLPLAVIMAASCSGTKENPDAVALLDSATAAYESGQLEESFTLLDSLQKAFPAEITVQRRAMALRPQVIESQAMRQIAAIDSMTAADNASMERLKPLMKWVKTPGMIEGYYTDAKTYNPSFMNGTGIEPRVSEIGQFYIVSSLNPAGGLHHVGVSVSGANASVATPSVPYDGESNYRIGSGEVITFSPEQSDTIGKFVSDIMSATPSAKASLSFIGEKGKNRTVSLSAAQMQAIANTYGYSNAIIRARDNQVERQRLEKTIEIARRQAAVAATPREE